MGSKPEASSQNLVEIWMPKSGGWCSTRLILIVSCYPVTYGGNVQLFTYSGPHSEACWSYGKLPLVLRITIANKRILFWCDLSWCRPGAAVKAAGRSWTTLCLTGHSLLSDCTSSTPTVLWLGTALMAVLVAVNAVGTETEALFDVRLNHVGLWCLCQRRQGNVVRWGTIVLIVGERILSHHFLLLELHLWQASCWCILGEKDQVLESLQCIFTAGCLYSFYNFFIHIYSNINYFSHPKEAWLYHPEIVNTTQGDSFILDDDKQPGWDCRRSVRLWFI